MIERKEEKRQGLGLQISLKKNREKKAEKE